MQSSSHPNIQWLQDHHISNETVSQIGITHTSERVSIPIRDRAGNILFRKHRLFGGTAKYLYEKGSTAQLFGQEDIDKHFTVVITEGEADALALRSFGIFAVSSTGGAGTFRAEWAEMFRGREVYICYDRDLAGAHGMLRVLRHIPDAYLVMLPQFGNSGTEKDICDYLRKKTSDDFRKLMRDAMQVTLPSDHRKTYKIKEYKDILRNFSAIRNFDNYFYIDYWLKILAAELHELSRPNWTHGTTSGGKDDLSRIRAYPIENFVKFNQGVALCVFHSEKIPSMHLNGARTQMPNTVKCYSCSKFGGVIDVVMAQQHCSFADAVKFIKEKMGI